MGGKPFFHFFENFLTQKQFFFEAIDCPKCAKDGSNEADRSLGHSLGRGLRFRFQRRRNAAEGEPAHTRHTQS